MIFRGEVAGVARAQRLPRSRRTAVSPLAPFVGWAPGSAPSTLNGRLSPQSTAISPGSLGDGRFCASGPGDDPVMVVLPGSSTVRVARSQGSQIPADNFLNELARV